jgi:hypothetical protein
MSQKSKEAGDMLSKDEEETSASSIHCKLEAALV